MPSLGNWFWILSKLLGQYLETTFTLTLSLALPGQQYSKCTSLDCGRKPEDLGGTQTLRLRMEKPSTLLLWTKSRF